MTMQTAVLASIWTEFAVATLLMGMRTAASRLTHSLRADYWLACITYVVGLCANIFNTISVHYGAGKHGHELSPSQTANAIRWQWILFQTYVIAHMFAKLSIIAFLLEIERKLTKKRRYVLFTVGFLNVAVNMSTSSLQWCQCRPVQKTWDDSIEGVCHGRERNMMGGYVQGSVGAAIDVFLAVYPIVVFWTLQLDRRVKVGLCALFGWGVLCAACAVLKTIGISTLTASDASYQLATLDIYSLTEMWVALIVGCIPPSKKLFSHASRRLAESSKQTDYGCAGGGDDTRISRATFYGVKGPSKYPGGGSKKEPSPSEETIFPIQDGAIMMTKSFDVDRFDSNRP